MAEELKVPIAGSIITDSDIDYATRAVNSRDMCYGEFNVELTRRLSAYMSAPFVSLCNSGSSANLLAVTALMQPELGRRQLHKGDEVITTALGFPTTVNPIIQNGLVPVFVDVRLDDNVDVHEMHKALSDKTRAVVLSHTLGRPFDVYRVMEFCKEHGLWLIEDACDAFGTEVNGIKCGTFGDIGALSFYPAHQMTTGEGGAVITSNGVLNKIIVSLRDWGRDCTCVPGQDNRCGRRYDGGYDHKYTYSRIGYNLKMTNIQAAIGCSQIQGMDATVRQRMSNYRHLYDYLRGWEMEWNRAERSFPFYYPPILDSVTSWFGFPIMIRDRVGIDRRDLCQYLNDHDIGTRYIMGGNLTRQPAYQGIERRIVGTLLITNRLHERAFWTGVWEGLDVRHMLCVGDNLREYCEKRL